MAIQPLTNLPVSAGPAPQPQPAPQPVARSAPPVENVEVPVASAQAAAARPDAAQVHAAVESINRKLSESSNNLRFSVDDKTGQIIVRIVDGETDQVIRQIPSEEAIAISQSIEQLQGLLVHHTA